MAAMETDSLIDVEEDNALPPPPEETNEDKLFDAVRKNHLDNALAVVKVANVNKVGSSSVAPLYIALENQNVAMVKMLLNNGADVNLLSYCHKYCTYETPIVTAARLQNLELVDVFLKKGCLMEGASYSPNSKTALQWAASHGNTALADKLVSHGADINWIGMFLHTALHYATISDKVVMVEWLLERGADIDVNGEGRTPLHIASVRGNLKIVKSLLSKTSKNCHIDTKDHFNFTPLSLACLRGHIAVAKHLLDNCPKNLELDLNEGLQKAAEGGHLNVINFLLDSGADVNSTNASGENALAVAAKSQYAIACALLDRGANINAIDNRGYTSLQHALIRDQRDISALLIQHGALLNTSASTESPLSIAFTMNNPMLVKHILQAGCHMLQEKWFNPVIVKEQIQEADFRIPGSMRYRPESVRLKQMWEWVYCTFGRTRNLRQLARIAVREQLVVASGGSSILSNIEKLPLPPAIKAYLTLSDISEEEE